MNKLIDNEVEKETKSLVVRTEKLLLGFKVNSQPTLIKANDYLVEITQAEKKIIKREREILDPLNEAKKSIITFFRPFKEKLTSIKWQLKKEMGSYVAEIEKKEIEKKAEIEKKVIDGKIGIDKAFEKINKFEEKKEVTTIRTNRVIKIIDKSKIPSKYWVIDTVLLRKDVLSGVIGEKEGVKIEEQKIIVGK